MSSSQTGTGNPGIGHGAAERWREARAQALARSLLQRSAVDIARAPLPRARRPRAVLAAFAGVSLLLATGVAVRQLRPAAPSVERATVWLDTVRRGAMVREVFGHGRLAPVDVRWLTARHPAQVERVLVAPGSAVRADTVLLVLQNAEIELGALEAERELARASAELVQLEEQLRAQGLAQQSVIATLESELGEAARRARADEELARRGFLSALEQGQTLGRERELGQRLQFEQQRLAAVSRGSGAQLQAQHAQIERLRSIALVRRREVEALAVRAGVDGVLAELALEQGQSVAAGAPLAKLVRPERLQAEVRIPETQATDLSIGQRATIDTRNGVVSGHVSRIAPAVQAGTVRVDVAFDGPLPPGARPDLNVEGIIELERLEQVLFVKRPALAVPSSNASLFRLSADGEHVERVSVALGRSSRELIEIAAGLREGDRVILSDLSQWEQVDRLRLR